MKARIVEYEKGWPEEVLILFTYKECPANIGRTSYYSAIDGHGEASDEFVKLNCRKPATLAEKLACVDAIKRYREETARIEAGIALVMEERARNSGTLLTD